MRSRFRGKRKRSRQKELVEIQLRTLAMDYWSVLEYHIYTAWILKIKIQAVILIPACHWQIIINSFDHKNLVKINDSVMESSYTYGQVKIPHRTMIYLERELAPMEELYKDREKSGGIL